MDTRSNIDSHSTEIFPTKTRSSCSFSNTTGTTYILRDFVLTCFRYERRSAGNELLMLQNVFDEAWWLHLEHLHLPFKLIPCKDRLWNKVIPKKWWDDKRVHETVTWCQTWLDTITPHWATHGAHCAIIYCLQQQTTSQSLHNIKQNKSKLGQSTEKQTRSLDYHPIIFKKHIMCIWHH